MGVERQVVLRVVVDSLGQATEVVAQSGNVTGGRLERSRILPELRAAACLHPRIVVVGAPQEVRTRRAVEIVSVLIEREALDFVSGLFQVRRRRKLLE